MLKWNIVSLSITALKLIDSRTVFSSSLTFFAVHNIKMGKVDDVTAVIGSCLCFLVPFTQVLGTIFIWGNISVYVTSYLRLYDPSVSLEDTFVVLPIIVIAKAPVNYLGARACVKFGTRM